MFRMPLFLVMGLFQKAEMAFAIEYTSVLFS